MLRKYPIVINAGVHEGQEMYDLMNVVKDVRIYAIEASRLCYDSAFNQFKNYENITFIKKAIVSSDRKGKVSFTDFLSNGKHYTYGGVQDFSEFRSNGQVYEVETTNIKEMIEICEFCFSDSYTLNCESIQDDVKESHNDWVENNC